MKPSVSKKLLGRWKGPYTVIAKLSDTTYKVKRDRFSTASTYHINFLQQWHAPLAICLLAEETDQDLPCWNEEGPLQPIQVNAHLDQDQAQQLSSLLKHFRPVFSNLPGSTTLTQMTIETGDSKPISTPPYRIPHARQAMARAEVKAMLEAGIIRPSRSPWAAPMLLVHKKDGSMRPVVDYRRLNKVTKRDPFPMPLVDDMIDQLASARYITTLDLTKGYWQVPVEPRDVEKTAFVTTFGKYEFLMMPFGLMGAPAVFQRLMNTLFGDALDHAAAYIDDVVIFSPSWNHHLTHLSDALDRIQKAGLTLKAVKCQIAQEECNFLGHVVGRGKVRPEQAKIEAIQAFRTPKTKRDVRAFLGLAGYYRKFVSNFSTIAHPLTELTRKIAPDKVVWGAMEQQAFRRLKTAMSSAPVLQGPDYTKEFVLQTDASEVGVHGCCTESVRGRWRRPPSGVLLKETPPQREELCHSGQRMPSHS